MKISQLKVLSICLLITVSPAMAKHHKTDSAARDIADKTTSGIFDSFKKVFEGLAKALVDQNELTKIIGDSILKKDLSFDNLAEHWAEESSRDIVNTFDDKLHKYASERIDKYKELRNLYGKDDDNEAAYQFALVTEISKREAKDTDKRLKKHANNIKALSQQNTVDLKSAQDLSNQHSVEQSTLLNELLREQSKTNRQLAAKHEFEINEQARKLRFHDFGGK